MQLIDLRTLLESHPQLGLAVVLPDGRSLPAHFHITEVGKITKDFIDCGGTRRTSQSCILQTLVADDVDHRLHAGKLASILEMSGQLGIGSATPIEVECQLETIGIFELAEARMRGERIELRLKAKQTACLAPDQCGIPDQTVTQIGLTK